MKFINGILNFTAFNGALAAGILYILGYEKPALIPGAISLFSIAVLAYLYLCKMYLVLKLKKGGQQFKV